MSVSSEWCSVEILTADSGLMIRSNINNEFSFTSESHEVLNRLPAKFSPLWTEDVAQVTGDYCYY